MFKSLEKIAETRKKGEMGHKLGMLRELFSLKFANDKFILFLLSRMDCQNFVLMKDEANVLKWPVMPFSIPLKMVITLNVFN